MISSNAEASPSSSSDAHLSSAEVEATNSILQQLGIVHPDAPPTPTGTPHNEDALPQLDTLTIENDAESKIQVPPPDEHQAMINNPRHVYYEDAIPAPDPANAYPKSSQYPIQELVEITAKLAADVKKNFESFSDVFFISPGPGIETAFEKELIKLLGLFTQVGTTSARLMLALNTLVKNEEARRSELEKDKGKDKKREEEGVVNEEEEPEAKRKGKSDADDFVLLGDGFTVGLGKSWGDGISSVDAKSSYEGAYAVMSGGSFGITHEYNFGGGSVRGGGRGRGSWRGRGRGAARGSGRGDFGPGPAHPPASFAPDSAPGWGPDFANNDWTGAPTGNANW